MNEDLPSRQTRDVRAEGRGTSAQPACGERDADTVRRMAEARVDGESGQSDGTGTQSYVADGPEKTPSSGGLRQAFRSRRFQSRLMRSQESRRRFPSLTSPLV